MFLNDELSSCLKHATKSTVAVKPENAHEVVADKNGQLGEAQVKHASDYEGLLKQVSLLSSELKKAVLISKNNQKKVKQLTSEFERLTEVNKELTRDLRASEKKVDSKKIDALERANKDLTQSMHESEQQRNHILAEFDQSQIQLATCQSLYDESQEKYQEVKKECARMSYRVIQMNSLLDFFMTPIAPYIAPIKVGHLAQGWSFTKINKYHRKELITPDVLSALTSLIKNALFRFNIYLYGSSLPYSPYQSVCPSDIDFAVLFDPSELLKNAFDYFLDSIKSLFEYGSVRVIPRVKFSQVQLHFASGSIDFTIYNKTLKQVMRLSPFNDVFCRVLFDAHCGQVVLGPRWDWGCALQKTSLATPVIGVVNKDWFKKTAQNPDKSNFKNIVFVIKKLSRAYAHGFHFKDEVFSCLSMMLKNMRLPREESDREFFLKMLHLNALVSPPANPQTRSRMSPVTLLKPLLDQYLSFLLYVDQKCEHLHPVSTQVDFFRSHISVSSNASMVGKATYAVAARR